MFQRFFLKFVSICCNNSAESSPESHSCILQHSDFFSSVAFPWFSFVRVSFWEIFQENAHFNGLRRMWSFVQSITQIRLSDIKNHCFWKTRKIEEFGMMTDFSPTLLCFVVAKFQSGWIFVEVNKLSQIFTHQMKDGVDDLLIWHRLDFY